MPACVTNLCLRHAVDICHRHHPGPGQILRHIDSASKSQSGCSREHFTHLSPESKAQVAQDEPQTQPAEQCSHLLGVHLAES